MSNYLEGQTIYLSGPIESLPDCGVEWRQHIRQLIKENHLPINIIDPCDKGLFHGEVGEDKDHIDQLIRDNKFNEVRQIMKKIRRWDLRACDYASAAIVKINRNVPTWGTIDEAVTIERQQKPVLLIIDGGIKNCPKWMLAIAKIHEIFATIEECITYLIQLNKGIVEIDDRWQSVKIIKSYEL